MAATSEKTFGFPRLLAFLDRLRWRAERGWPGCCALATHMFAGAGRKRGAGFSFGFPVDERIQAIVDLIPLRCWHPVIEPDCGLREGAWVAEATGMTDLSS